MRSKREDFDYIYSLVKELGRKALYQIIRKFSSLSLRDEADGMRENEFGNRLIQPYLDDVSKLADTPT